MDKIINELADLAAKHKLVPFLGAGCSVPHLKVDWDTIRDGLAEELSTDEQDHLVVAQQYVDTFSH